MAEIALLFKRSFIFCVSWLDFRLRRADVDCFLFGGVRIFVAVLFGLFIATINVGCRQSDVGGVSNLPNRSTQQSAQKNIPQAAPQRIVSTTPAITELLFEVGLGDRVVGDSQFTVYPPEAAKIEKIGGLYDRNNEKILSLKPDLVIYPVEDVQFRQTLLEMGLVGLGVDHRSLAGVLESYELVGKCCGGDSLAIALDKRRVFENFLQECRDNSGSRERGRLGVLVCVDRQRGTNRIDGVYVAAKGTFFDEVINLAGGKNAVTKSILPYPNITAEAIIEFNPDVIIDIQVIRISQNNDNAIESLRNDWQTLHKSINAVKNNNVFIITDDYAPVPGPRTPLLIKKFREILDACDLDKSN
ncbi:MAG: ABC transporter substrate-binding protein [Planctomycetaceae bacterium]|jgi:iron complex transport system substrate-binding protein|nr:ABC transporter substrate-binding protein [Planctomycetaceae bacterium]